MKQKIYIETTIPSFYYETRTETEMVAMQEWTQNWWDNQQHHYDLVTSIPVIEELENRDHPSKQATLELISKLPILPIHEEIEEIVEEYVTHYIMPNDPKGDALHLALASYHRCHFLLTWNCAHLANANKFEHIRHINTMLGLYVPILTTPYELLYWEEK
jgi:predicted nucleic acid-binding protein